MVVEGLVVEQERKMDQVKALGIGNKDGKTKREYTERTDNRRAKDTSV